MLKSWQGRSTVAHDISRGPESRASRDSGTLTGGTRSTCGEYGDGHRAVAARDIGRDASREAGSRTTRRLIRRHMTWRGGGSLPPPRCPLIRGRTCAAERVFWVRAVTILNISYHVGLGDYRVGLPFALGDYRVGLPFALGDFRADLGGVPSRGSEPRPLKRLTLWLEAPSPMRRL
jgi:hypothetical protein